MSKEFQKQVVAISGGLGALGSTVTQGFVKRGAKVIVPFVSEMRLNTVLIDHPGMAQAVRFDRVDLGNSGHVKKFVETIREREGRLDILINLAGGYRGGINIEESSSSEFAYMMEQNFKTLYLVTRDALPLMRESGAGRIVNVGSRGGLRGTAGNAAYAIAKSAVIRFTEALSEEVKHDGINVNCVCPSIIDTPGNRMEMPDMDPAGWVTAEEVADVIYFLASEQSRALHGVIIPVYGTG